MRLPQFFNAPASDFFSPQINTEFHRVKNTISYPHIPKTLISDDPTLPEVRHNKISLITKNK